MRKVYATVTIDLIMECDDHVETDQMSDLVITHSEEVSYDIDLLDSTITSFVITDSK